MSLLTTLRLAVCLFQGVTALDFQGPVEILGFLAPDSIKRFKTPPTYIIEITYLGHTLDPVTPDRGPLLVPSRTYNEIQGEQFDIILIPGGTGGRPGRVPTSLPEFVQRQAPGAKHILTVCTGSWILAGTGLLRGRKATSNKSVFKELVEATRDDGVEWVARARYVVNDDKKVWTSSGVTAGMDMASAFLDFLVGKEVGDVTRGVVELIPRGSGDDEFAAYYGID